MITVTSEHATKLASWIKDRGGVAVWKSVDLSDPGASSFTPAITVDGTPYQKPHWKYANEPSKIVTKPEDVQVSVDKEVRRFHVAVRMGSQGLSMKLTDASSRKVREAVAKAGEGAYYVFDYGDYKNCVILAPEKTVPLTEWEG